MMRYRPEQLAEQIRCDLAHIIRFELRDARVGFVTISWVDVSPDLACAKVYVTFLEQDELSKQSLHVLNRACSFFRKRLSQISNSRCVPRLCFVLDVTEARARRIDELLQNH